MARPARPECFTGCGSPAPLAAPEEASVDQHRLWLAQATFQVLPVCAKAAKVRARPEAGSSVDGAGSLVSPGGSGDQG